MTKNVLMKKEGQEKWNRSHFSCPIGKVGKCQTDLALLCLIRERYTLTTSSDLQFHQDIRSRQLLVPLPSAARSTVVDCSFHGSEPPFGCTFSSVMDVRPLPFMSYVLIPLQRPSSFLVDGHPCLLIQDICVSCSSPSFFSFLLCKCSDSSLYLPTLQPILSMFNRIV